MEKKKMKKSTKIGIVAVIAVVFIASIFLLTNKNVFLNVTEGNDTDVQKEKVQSDASWGEEPGGSTEALAETSGEPAEPVEVPEVDKSVYMDATQDIEVRIDALMAQMTLEEKAAQMVQPEQAAITPADIAKYNLGSVLSGGGSAPRSGNTVKHWQNNVDNMKNISVTQTRLGIPLL